MILMDKVYIITGGSSGLGKAFTHDLVVNFAKVIITGRDKKKLEKVARDLGCLAFHADVRSDEDIDALMKFTMDTFGKLDGIINNAGVGGWSSIEELSREKMKEVYEVNVSSLDYCHVFLPSYQTYQILWLRYLVFWLD